MARRSAEPPGLSRPWTNTSCTGARTDAPVALAHAATIKKGSGSALCEAKTRAFHPDASKLVSSTAAIKEKQAWDSNCLCVRGGHVGRHLESR